MDLAPDPVHPPPMRPDAADPSLRSGNKRRDVEFSEEEEGRGVLRDRGGSLRGSRLGRVFLFRGQLFYVFATLTNERKLVTESFLPADRRVASAALRVLPF